MRVLIAPDCFGGSLSASAAADAIAAGWRRVAPDDELDLVPLSDGGPGFVEVLAAGAGDGAQRIPVATSDAWDRPVTGTLLRVGDTVYVETAHACGLDLLAPAERDPERASTAGVAALLTAAVDTGATRVVLGLGGSATTDGGRGLLTRLDAAMRARAMRLALVAATDVDNPLLGLTGAAATFGPQKGADASAVQRLEMALEQYARELGALDLAALPGAGAAGGLGFALYTLGAQRTPGFEVVRDAVGLRARVAIADLVVTGEGRYDSVSLRGKVPGNVAALAAAEALPCVVLAGQVTVGRREAAAHGVTESHALLSAAASAGARAVAASIADAADRLANLAARVATQWSLSRRT